MRRTIAIIASLVLICSCAGCSGGDKNVTKSPDKINENIEDNVDDISENKDVQKDINAIIKTFPSEYHYESEFLDIDISNITPHEAVWYETKCKDYPIDFEKVGRLFMPDDGTNTMIVDDHIILSNETVDGISKESYAWGPKSGGYRNSDENLIINSIRADERYFDYNLDVYKEKKDFSFGTEEEVKQKLYDEFNKIGINLENDFACDTYYLDYNTMKEQEEYVYMGIEGEEIHPNRTDWSEKDDAYCMYFHHICNGLRDFQEDDMGMTKAMNECGQIKVIYNTNGIVSCNIQNMYEYSISDEQVMLMDFEDVMSSVIKHYSNIVDGTKRKIISAELIAGCADHASAERKLIPVWAFWVEDEISDDSEVYITRHELRVNAVTGKVIK